MNKIAISLGWNCHSASYGVEHGIRSQKINGYKTCPFDMMVSNYQGIVDCIKDDFKYFYDENYLSLIKINEKETEIRNTKYNFVFNHENPGHADLYISENWKEGINHFINNNFYHFKERYQRRIENFRNYLLNPNNYIIFIITTWKKSLNDMSELKEALNTQYPNLQYEILIIDDPNGEEYYMRHMRYLGVIKDENKDENQKMSS